MRNLIFNCTNRRWNVIVNNMPCKIATVERATRNDEKTETLLIELKSQLKTLAGQFNEFYSQELQKENVALAVAIEQARKSLTKLEVGNGTHQIPICTNCKESNMAISQPPVASNDQLKKEKKVKIAANKKTPGNMKDSNDDVPIDVGRLDLRIAKVKEVQKHPNADSLYVLKIDCGESKLRTVCAGLAKFVPMESLRDRYVLALCNLKAVSMRGILSEAMLMCASQPEMVEVLIPPAGCQAGDLVQCQGYNRNPDPIMNPKKKIFEAVAPHLSTNESLQACYKQVPLHVPDKGYIVAVTLKCCQVK